MKHSNIHLRWVSACDDKHRVNGFQFRYHFGTPAENVERFHSKRPSYSFNMELRRHWAGLYLLGDHAGRAVIATLGAPNPIYEPVSEAYMRMLELPAFVFWSESDVPLALVREYGNTMEVSLDGATKVPVRALRTTSITLGDSLSAGAEIPDT